MKFRIEKGIEKSRLKDIVPTEYKGLASALEPKIEGIVTLITFPHNRKDVVKSSMARKAIKKLDTIENHNIVVLGGCFSKESVDILKSYNAYFLNLSEFHWTDSSHVRIKSGEPKSIDKP